MTEPVAEAAARTATTGPAVSALLDRVAEVWPEHVDYLTMRFAGQDESHLEFCEALAARIIRIAGDGLDRLATNYRWTCERMLEEEFRFGLTGRYRHDCFAQVVELVYGDADFMARYLDGLLLSQLLWANHTRSLEIYEGDFLAHLGPHSRLLEVGPGHGLLLAAAAIRGPARLVGWDVSAASLAATDRALAAMNVGSVTLERRDLLLAPADHSFDLVVASELVEHLDQPGEALRRLAGLTAPGGRLYLNIPVNSPAPDHISLWRSPEELFAFVERNGLTIVDKAVSPMTGHTEQQARERGLTLSCVAICQCADG
ncbi:MAG TPA: class I SAM-dependent methyltransferase [Pseudonocardiaceae bacterium]|jgi:2-polyprenyl-3-methyl-5-hydroxy-6-metoxy-1,4-benzoquinol methylase|nr:class I SAM-dependent methyltransferase [Pseudonocardiaceae bacterium]